MNKLFVFLFTLCFLLGVFLRFYQLGSVPQSLDWDEVSQAYNSYSLLVTGKDEYNNSYPWTIRSFNDYKAPIYVYVSTLPMKFFGMNAITERLPSAIAGMLTILFTYFLTYEIFYRYPFKKTIGLLSMFFFAISPWSIQFSRTAFDANLALFFVVLGSWLFLYGIRKKILFSYIGVLSLGVSIYTTHSEKIFSPLFFVCLVLFSIKYLLKRKTILVSLIILFVVINLFWFLDSKTRIRSGGVLFTASPVKILEPSIKQFAYDQEHKDLLGVLHNRRLIYINKYLENYLSHFNLDNLFIYGDNARHHAPGVGVLYLVSLPFLVCGLYYLVSRRIYAGFLVIAWIIIAPMASGFAIDAPNYQRSLIFLPSWQILEAFGWYFFFKKTKEISKGKYVFCIAVLLLFLNICYYIHQYFQHTDSVYGKYWQYGYKEAIDYAKQFRNTNKRVIVEDDIEQAYMFYLYYNEYDPIKYLSEGGSNRKENPCFSIDNTFFGSCKQMIQTGSIYITSFEQNKSFRLLKAIDYKNGQRAVNVYLKL
jgi:4-amino-4-deoxy-L-arabinose transferase-like glycosyltransferase